MLGPIPVCLRGHIDYYSLQQLADVNCFVCNEGYDTCGGVMVVHVRVRSRPATLNIFERETGIRNLLNATALRIQLPTWTLNRLFSSCVCKQMTGARDMASASVGT